MILQWFHVFFIFIAKQVKKHKTRQNIQGGGVTVEGDNSASFEQTLQDDASVNISDLDVQYMKDIVQTFTSTVNTNQILSNVTVGGTAGNLLDTIVTLLGQLLAAVNAILNTTGLTNLVLMVLGLLGLIIRVILLILAALL